MLLLALSIGICSEIHFRQFKPQVEEVEDFNKKASPKKEFKEKMSFIFNYLIAKPGFDSLKLYK